MPLAEHEQLQVAIIQLERAIKLFLDDKDYYSSATLAGASEGILRGYATERGNESASKEEAMRSMSFLSEEEIRALAGDKNKDTIRAFLYFLNEEKNWLKHYDKEFETMMMDIEDVAYRLIERAVEDLHKCGKNSDQEARLREYAAHRY